MKRPEWISRDTHGRADRRPASIRHRDIDDVRIAIRGGLLDQAKRHIQMWSIPANLVGLLGLVDLFPMRLGVHDFSIPPSNCVRPRTRLRPRTRYTGQVMRPVFTRLSLLWTQKS